MRHSTRVAPALVRLRARACLLLGALCLSLPAQADIGPDLADAVAMFFLFPVVLIAVPLLAGRGWRIFGLLATFVGFPLSMQWMSQLAVWVSEDHYTNTRLTSWLTLMTWGYVALTLLFLRLAGSLRGAPASGEPHPLRKADLAFAFTLFALALETRVAVRIGFAWGGPYLGPLLVSAYWSLGVVAAMGLWHRQRWAWWLALVTSSVALLLTIYIGARPGSLPGLYEGPHYLGLILALFAGKLGEQGALALGVIAAGAAMPAIARLGVLALLLGPLRRPSRSPLDAAGVSP